MLILRQFNSFWDLGVFKPRLGIFQLFETSSKNFENSDFLNFLMLSIRKKFHPENSRSRVFVIVQVVLIFLLTR